MGDTMVQRFALLPGSKKVAGLILGTVNCRCSECECKLLLVFNVALRLTVPGAFAQRLLQKVSAPVRFTRAGEAVRKEIG